MAVVVGFIPTDVGFKALTAARAEAEQRGGPLIVVNVLRDGVSEDPRHADEQHLEIARDHLRGSVVRVEFRQETTEDDIADVLLDVVEDEDAELLVLGVRRQQDLARHLLGLTVQKLLLSANSEVLVGGAPCAALASDRSSDSRAPPERRIASSRAAGAQTEEHRLSDARDRHTAAARPRKGTGRRRREDQAFSGSPPGCSSPLE